MAYVRAFVISNKNGRFSAEVEEVPFAPTNESSIVVKVAYSGINYKDALAAQVASKVRKVDWLIGGVDASGEVLSSAHPEFPPGTKVSVHGGDFGSARNGGFAELVDALPSELAVLPASLSVRDAMIVGTAGFAAMASLLALRKNGLAEGGKILISGASGGVGSFAVAFASKLGYLPIAATRSMQHREWLTALGASEVIPISEIDVQGGRQLGQQRWDGAVDCVGGHVLQEILKTLKYGAAVAASGLVENAQLSTTVYPFITRANSLLGIDCVNMPPEQRDFTWREIATLCTELNLEQFVDTEVSLDGISSSISRILAGNTRGRVLVHPAS